MGANQTLTVYNWTEDLLVFHSGHLSYGLEHVLEPRTSISVKSTRNFVLSPFKEKYASDFQSGDGVKELGTLREIYSVRLKKRGMAFLQAKVSQDCPWRVYRRKLSRKRQNVLIFSKRNMAAFLSEIPDSLALSSVCLPGTHDTMAFYGWPMSQCQAEDTPLAVQLRAGIRVLDIRLAVKEGRLISYHGQYSERTPFTSILRDLYAFLTNSISSRETVIVSIKQEDYDDTDNRVFSHTVRGEIEASEGGLGMWYLANKIPLLGEVRGKAIMFSRFGRDGAEWPGRLEGMGIHPTTWPDNEKKGFAWVLKNTLVRTQDWYHIGSFLDIPEKVALATAMLLPPPAREPPVPVLSITYFSASSFPLAAPSVISSGFGWPNIGLGVEGVNSHVGRWLLDVLSNGSKGQGVGTCDLADGPKIRGWTLMDFYMEPFGSDVVPLLVECNFRGRSNEEGWAR